ncbi:MAG: ureidoglycolate lyase [Woeseiaceae bacterium]
MTEWTLDSTPLTPGAFAPFGDVIEASSATNKVMNEARFERFHDLALIDVDTRNNGHVAISIAESKVPVTLPYRFDIVERHPLGSQAFIPLGNFSFTIVVAPAGKEVNVEDLAAFSTNGAQGINYHRGTWHMPLISTAAGEKFLIVDRAPGIDNCDELVLSTPVVLHA